ncbi:hypothetical protein SAMN00777080_2796 [Aquiflexum balticum DSM 16537]|uniref:Uncharacterized protein n=1 Tax=Aquiflexum balticum DSM 16537 TaxID=758820 RepID=A0A1W2H6C6_9BACT|nr:hypothetical protein SAMN00777080_2796 [Aquiflexum balticum DSM 16537]
MTDLEIAPRQARGTEIRFYKGESESGCAAFHSPPPDTITPVAELAEAKLR